MSYDIEQAQKAIREKRLQDNINYLRLLQHKDCVKNVTRYGLPYRVLWDRERNIVERNILEIDINPFYPLPKAPKQGEHTAGQYKQWDLVTEQGIQAWERLFTRFIVPYKEKIPTWKAFDFWGNTEHTAEETERKRAYYINLIADYESNPHKYDTEPRYKQLEDYELYDFSGFVGYMWHDDFENKPPEHPQALQIMYKERELTEQTIRLFTERCKTIHEPPPDIQHRLQHINEIISKLEQEVQQ